MMKVLLAFGAIAMLATYVNGQTGKRRAVKMGTPNGIFSPAIVTGDLVYTSGQIGIDPKTNQLAEGFEAQLEQVFKNLTTVLEASGSDIDHVVKATVFLADMNDYNKLNELYPKKFKGDPPARTCCRLRACRVMRASKSKLSQCSNKKP